MTKPRYDTHGTEFGSWLRVQPEIDSGLGYVATNVDYMWRNYKTGLWMLIEEKRHSRQPKRWQQQMFGILDKVSRRDPNYRGFHILVFEKTSPEDGRMWLDGELITRQGLIGFLTFAKEVDR